MANKLTDSRGRLTVDGRNLARLFLDAQGATVAALIAQLTREYGAVDAAAFVDAVTTLDAHGLI